MAPSGQAIAASAAHDVAFAADQVAGMEIVDVGSDLHDFADELVADGHGYGNGALRPLIPVVDVQIGPADTGAKDAHQYVVDPDARLRNFFEPEARLAFTLDERFH